MMGCRNSLLERIGQLNRNLPADEKAAWLAAQIGMELPTMSSRHAHSSDTSQDNMIPASPEL
jgi:hypothetical protein